MLLKSATYEHHVWLGQLRPTETTDKKVVGFLWTKVNTELGILKPTMSINSFLLGLMECVLDKTIILWGTD